MTFETWLATVDALVVSAYGMSLNDLPDLWLVRDAYDDGVTPEDWFDDHLGSIDQLEEVMFS